MLMSYVHKQPAQWLKYENSHMARRLQVVVLSMLCSRVDCSRVVCVGIILAVKDRGLMSGLKIQGGYSNRWDADGQSLFNYTIFNYSKQTQWLTAVINVLLHLPCVSWHLLLVVQCLFFFWTVTYKGLSKLSVQCHLPISLTMKPTTPIKWWTLRGKMYLN